MRYSKEHKVETRGRIVAKAATRLRERGLHGIGVADLMKEAGLTHGGFYAHFESREALVIEAFSRTMDASIRNWRESVQNTPPGERFEKLIGNYLTARHRDAPGRGCAVPTLGADITRESPKTRRAFAAKVEEMIAEIASFLPAASKQEAKRQAIVALSTMIGTLLLSRIAGTGQLSDDILSTGRDTARGTVATSRPARRRKAAAPQS